MNLRHILFIRVRGAFKSILNWLAKTNRSRFQITFRRSTNFEDLMDFDPRFKIVSFNLSATLKPPVLLKVPFHPQSYLTTMDLWSSSLCASTFFFLIKWKLCHSFEFLLRKNVWLQLILYSPIKKWTLTSTMLWGKYSEKYATIRCCHSCAKLMSFESWSRLLWQSVWLIFVLKLFSLCNCQLVRRYKHSERVPTIQVSTVWRSICNFFPF